ncbi:MAG: methylthioribulose 1-phosphate dehydratase [Bacteroidetes bacterium]|nr:methylthioribulose 1-phosphate dehydratase [Bacteroidota bacterium]
MKSQLVQTIRHYNNKGWSPATSTNYSFRDAQGIWVTRSGIDKSEIIEDDFILVSDVCEPIGEYSNLIPSAETEIHCMLYKIFPEARVILHSHNKFPVLCSTENDLFIEFEGLEIQKGFRSINSHNQNVKVPILDNSQEMSFFIEQLSLRRNELKFFCFIIRQHGTYAWGETLLEAKRHLETLDFLCECWWEKNK